MAQLPPKIPTIATQDRDHQPNCHNQTENHHQWLEQLTHDDGPNHHHPEDGCQNPSWMDEFIEFSATKREAQRRLASDSSVAFIESTTTTTGLEGSKQGHDQFDKFDDEQFMSMFGTDLGSNPSSTSDHNSTNEDQKHGGGGGSCQDPSSKRSGDDKATTKPEVEEVQSSCHLDNKDSQQGHLPSNNGAPNAANVAADTQQVIDPYIPS